MATRSVKTARNDAFCRLLPTIAIVSSAEHYYFVDDRKALRVRKDCLTPALVEKIAEGAAVEELTRAPSYLSQDVLAELHSSGMLISVDELPETDTIWERQFGFLAENTSSPTAAQRSISASRVVIIGLGGIGSNVMQQLVGSGVQHLYLIDHDAIALHNLNRQFIFGAGDVGARKVDAAQKYILERNPSAHVLTHAEKVSSSKQLDHLLDGALPDLVVLAADEEPGVIDLVVSEYCEKREVAFVRGAVSLTKGYWGPLIAPGKTACYSCFLKRLSIQLSEEENVLARACKIVGQYSFGPVDSLIASQLAYDIVKFLAKCENIRCLGTRIQLDFEDLSTHRVFAPRCCCNSPKDIQPSRVEICDGNLQETSRIGYKTERIESLCVEIDALPPDLRHGHVIDHVGHTLARLIREPLFESEDTAGEVHGRAAVSAVPSDEYKCWTIGIAKDLYWSNGEQLTAKNVEQAIKYLSSSRDCPLSWLARTIGRKASSKSGWHWALEVLDDFRVRFHLEKPIAYFLDVLTNDCCSPRYVPSEVGEQNRELSSSPIASGPYSLTRNLPDGRGIVLSLNRSAKFSYPTSASNLIFLRTDSSVQGMRLYNMNHLQMTCNTTFPPDLLPAYKNSPDFLAADLSLTAQIQFGSRFRNRFGSLEFRRAISFALDRDAFAAALGDAVAPLWLYSGLWSNEQECIPKADADKARSLFSSSVRPSKLCISFADFSPNREIAQIVAEQIQDVLLLRVVLEPLSYLDYVRRTFSDDYELLFTVVSPAYEDPSSMLVPFSSSGFLSKQTQFVDQQFDHLLDVAEAEPDFDIRMEKYRAANRRLLEAVPVIPLARYRSAMLRKPWLKGVTVRRSGAIPFEEVFI